MVGYANGLAVMADEETRTLWDHITGEAFEGPLNGKTLATWPMFITTVAAELAQHPDTVLHLSSYRSLGQWFMGFVNRQQKLEANGFIPPPFYRSMATPIDPRLPKLTQGLGVIVEGQTKYYPLNTIAKGDHIDETWGEHTLRIERRAADGMLTARWLDSDELPMQLMTRWYGFAFTYPDCAIYKPPFA